MRSDRKQQRMNEKRKLEEGNHSQSVSIDMAAELSSSTRSTSDRSRDGRPDLERQDSNETMTMEHFLESAKIDHQTAKMMVKYDKDGNGQFDMGEVAMIVMDLRKEHRDNAQLQLTNSMFKKLLCGMCVAAIFILLAMAGVTYSVTVLLAKTDVDANGNLVVSGTQQIVATDARAEVHQVEQNPLGLLCVERNEVEEWRHEVTIGRNVLLQTTGLDGTMALTRLNGVGVEEVGDGLCFNNRAGGKTCWVPDAVCSTASSEWSSGSIVDFDHTGTARARH